MPVLVGDRITPVFAKAARRNPYSNRRLAAFVFTDAHEMDYALDVFTAVALRFNFTQALIMLDVRFHDAVEHVVRRQTVLVRLVRTQLGRRRARDNALRNYRRQAVAIIRKP